MIEVIIIDDETNNQDYLKKLLADNFPDINVAGTATTAIEGVKIINRMKPDLVFLDIQMPGGSGFECLESLADIDFEIIFVTAFDHYALNAIKFSALDYLLKPVNKAELQKAVDKARLRTSERAENIRLRNLISNNNGNTPGRLALSSVDKVEFVSVEDVIRCKGENNYTRFFLVANKEILVSQTLGEYELILSDYGFLRVHQSHIISLRHVDSFIKRDGGYLLMKDKSTVPVAASKKEMLLEKFLRKKK